jgi:hypothetical protein
MLSWFHPPCGRGNHGIAAGAVPGASRRGAGDGACMDTLADRSGTMAHAPLSPPRSPSPRLSVCLWFAQSRRAQRRLAVGGRQWGCDPLWCAASVGACQVGRRGSPG